MTDRLKDARGQGHHSPAIEGSDVSQTAEDTRTNQAIKEVMRVRSLFARWTFDDSAALIREDRTVSLITTTVHRDA